MTIQEMARANKAAGHHWFDAEAIRFFSSRIDRETFRSGPQHWLFVSSEKPPRGERRYSVRVFDSVTGHVDTVGDFMAYGSIVKAKAEAKRLAAQGVTK